MNILYSKLISAPKLQEFVSPKGVTYTIEQLSHKNFPEFKSGLNRLARTKYASKKPVYIKEFREEAEKVITGARSFILFARHNKDLLGAISCCYYSLDSAFILYMEVFPKYKFQQIATRLLINAFKLFKKVGAKTIDSSCTPAGQFFFLSIRKKYLSKDRQKIYPAIYWDLHSLSEFNRKDIDRIIQKADK